VERQTKIGLSLGVEFSVGLPSRTHWCFFGMCLDGWTLHRSWVYL